jgi:hypothetical protein
LPLIVRPIVPASLSTIGISATMSSVSGMSLLLIVRPVGSAMSVPRSPIRNTPNMPFGSFIWPWWCGWYIPIDGSSATNS